MRFMRVGKIRVFSVIYNIAHQLFRTPEVALFETDELGDSDQILIVGQRIIVLNGPTGRHLGAGR